MTVVCDTVAAMLAGLFVIAADCCLHGALQKEKITRKTGCCACACVFFVALWHFLHSVCILERGTWLGQPCVSARVKERDGKGNTEV